ncbi:MAG: urease accessory protein UreD [Clostridiales bacterium]|nr:urease accessory protein UreD [Clostridiales bacterium]
MSPFYLQNDAQACYYIMNPGGGYVDGDTYRMDITLSKQAELLLTTQSATKIYKTPNKPVTQEINIILKEGSLLEYFPDPIIGYKNSRYKQNTVVHMEKGTCFIATDIITSGWDSEGTMFSYDMLSSKTEVYLDGNMVILDHLRLNPPNQNINSLGFLEEHSHLGTMIVIGEKAENKFLTKLSESIESYDLKCKIGISMLSISGFTLRVMGFSTQEIEKVFNICHELIRKEWFGKSPVFLRKY